jgi:glutathione S-transferase
MITIHGFENTRSLRALWAAEEAGIDYCYARVDLKQGAARAPEFLRLNPGGKVPVLVEGDLVLSESVAICERIGRLGETLAPPPASVAYARCLQWCCFAVTELEQPLWVHAKHTFALPPAQRVPEVLKVVPWEFARAARVLAESLASQAFILGDQFTIADILLGHTLFWAQSRELPLGSECLEAYVRRLQARPALARAVARERDAMN